MESMINHNNYKNKEGVSAVPKEIDPNEYKNDIDQLNKEERIKPNKHSIKLLALSLKIEILNILKKAKGRNLQTNTSLNQLIEQANGLNEVNAKNLNNK